MERVVIAVADQVIAQELRSRLDELGNYEVAFVADSTSELVSVTLAHRPSLVFVHDQLEPGPLTPVLRDLALRQPALAVLVISQDTSSDVYSQAMDAGARGVISYPFSYEDLAARVTAAAEWSEHMRGVVASGLTAGSASGLNQGLVVTFAGAKGGVGTTILATHLAWDVATKSSGTKVCLVDLDLEKGDVPSYLDVSHRVSIADLAKIGDDMTARSVSDVVSVHTSGLHLLLTPREIRETEVVTPLAVRQVLGQLRTMYDLVVVDAGSNVTPPQAAAVEMSDEVVQVVTSDVPALRAARRQSTSWESLGVRDPATVKVLLNKFTRRSEIQQDTVDQLVVGQRLQVLVPELGEKLERAANSRTPDQVRDKAWWTSLRVLGGELDILRGTAAAGSRRSGGVDGAGPQQLELKQPDLLASALPTGTQAQADEDFFGLVTQPGTTMTTRAAAKQSTRRSRGLLGRRGDQGQIAIEQVALVPIALVVFVLCWQVVMLGLSFVWTGHAASAAARAASLGKSTTEVQQAAANAVPSSVADKMTVLREGNRVRVRIHASLLKSTTSSETVDVDVDRHVVVEP